MLRCAARARPAVAEMSWWVGGVAVSREVGEELRLPALPELAGETVQCRATNSLGTGAAQAKIRLHKPDAAPASQQGETHRPTKELRLG